LVHQRLYAIACGYPDGNDAVSRADLYPTDDPTHGAQQLTFFNRHYDSWCYLPVAGFLSFNDEPEQYLCAYLLRPGNALTTRGALGILARLRVRLDGGFAAPEIFDFLEAESLEYVVAMDNN
jgi:hypothetical protein